MTTNLKNLRRPLFFTIISVSIIFTVLYDFLANPFSQIALSQSTGNKYCYQENNSTIIFLHLNQESKLPWLTRCAFQTAAVKNNDTGVCVLYASEFPDTNSTLFQYENLEFAPLNISLILEDTPLLNWYNKYILGATKPTEFMIYEVADALRVAYLYKYGGKYMDTDSWTLRNLAQLQNIMTWESSKHTKIANGILFFEKAHPFLKAVMDNFIDNYDPKTWASVGPILVTKIHETGLANTSTYTVLEPRWLLPIHWENYSLPFDASRTEEVRGLVNESYALHLYGFLLRYHDLYENEPDEKSFVGEFLHQFCKE